MNSIIIVEENRATAKILTGRINSELGLITKNVTGLNEVKTLFKIKKHDYFVALIDMSAHSSELEAIINYISTKGLPSIVITDEFSDTKSEWMLSKNIVDYLIKEDLQDFDYILGAIHRVYKNQFIKVLVVDDSKILRKFIKKLLAIQNYVAIEASDGVEALAQLKKHPDIKLIITDFQMPRMNGFELTSQVRKKYNINQLAIIGISAHGSGLLSAKFLKKGANDFITKPFVNEEFNCRINQNIEILEYIEAVKQASNKDYLTGFYNRRYLFDLGNRYIQFMNESSPHITVAMIDIDHFKKINDQYGHHAGDIVLQHVSGILSEKLADTDIVCRFGGDEFCMLSTTVKVDKVKPTFERIRNRFKNEKIDIGKATISITVSIGVATQIADSLEATINRADELLYQAKESGRNRVITG
jgi:diguanylate cyclase (GGDEF)-like protein